MGTLKRMLGVFQRKKNTKQEKIEWTSPVVGNKPKSKKLRTGHFGSKKGQAKGAFGRSEPAPYKAVRHEKTAKGNCPKCGGRFRTKKKSLASGVRRLVCRQCGHRKDGEV